MSDYYKGNPFFAIMKSKCEAMLQMILTDQVDQSAFTIWVSSHIVAVGPVDMSKMPNYLLEDAINMYERIQGGASANDFFIELTDLMDEAEEYAITEDYQDDQVNVNRLTEDERH